MARRIALGVLDAVDVGTGDEHAAAVGALEPVIISNSVVLPAPLGPTTPMIPGLSMARLAWSAKVGCRTSRPRV